MVNLKTGGILLLAGTVLFLLSDTLFGDSQAAAYSMFFGLVMFPLGLLLTFVGLVQLAVAALRNKSKQE